MSRYSQQLRTGGLILLVAAAGALAAGCGGASATPTGPSGAAVVDAFVAATQAADRSMHLTLEGVVAIVGQEQRLRAEYDLGGPDFSGTSTVEGAIVGSQSGETVFVGGRTFRRTPDQAWTLDDESSGPVDPLSGISASDVSYVARETLDGRAVHRLAVRDPVAALLRALGPTASEGMGSITVRKASTAILVEGDGRPISADFELTATTSLGDLSAALHYAFSGWGVAVSITAPIDVPPTGAPGTVLTVYNRTTQAITARDAAGNELPVPACDQASAATFDTSRMFTIVGPDGAVLDVEFPPTAPGWVTRYLLFGPTETAMSPDAFGVLGPCGARPAP